MNIEKNWYHAYFYACYEAANSVGSKGSLYYPSIYMCFAFLLIELNVIAVYLFIFKEMLNPIILMSLVIGIVVLGNFNYYFYFKEHGDEVIRLYKDEEEKFKDIGSAFIYGALGLIGSAFLIMVITKNFR